MEPRKGLTKEQIDAVLAGIEDKKLREEARAYAYGEKEWDVLSEDAKGEAGKLLEWVQAAQRKAQVLTSAFQPRVVVSAFQEQGIEFKGESGDRIRKSLLSIVRADWTTDPDAADILFPQWFAPLVPLYIQEYERLLATDTAMSMARGRGDAQDAALALNTPFKKAQQQAFDNAYRNWVDRQTFGDKPAAAYLNSLKGDLFDRYYRGVMFGGTPEAARFGTMTPEGLVQPPPQAWDPMLFDVPGATGRSVPRLPPDPGLFLSGFDLMDVARETDTSDLGLLAQFRSRFRQQYIAPVLAGAAQGQDAAAAARIRLPLLEAALDSATQAFAAQIRENPPAVSPQNPYGLPDPGVTRLDTSDVIGRFLQERAGSFIRAATEPTPGNLEQQGQQARVQAQRDERDIRFLTEAGYSPAEIVTQLGMNPNQIDYVTNVAAPATTLRASQLAEATRQMPPGGGTIGLPIGREKEVLSTLARQLGARDAALNALTEGRYGQAAYRVLVAEAELSRREAAAQAQVGAANELRAEAARLATALGTGPSRGGLPVTMGVESFMNMNPQEVERYIAQARPLVAQKEYQAKVLEAMQPILQDKDFTPELARFVTQNRKVKSESDWGPAYETVPEVATRLASQVANLYDTYQTNKQRSAQQTAVAPSRIL